MIEPPRSVDHVMLLPTETLARTGPDARATGRSDRRRFGRWIGLGMLVVALAGVVLVAGSALTALSVRRDLTGGEAALRRARALLVQGEAAKADAAFRVARSRFSSAMRTSGNTWFAMLGWFPVLGRTTDAVSAIAEAGASVADAGGTLSLAASSIPGGLDAIAPRDGRVPLEHLGVLSDAAADASNDVAIALETLRAAPNDLLLGPVGPARDEAEEEIRSLDETLRTGAALLEGLPAFLGADGPEHYFFGAQNPAELRGTGGVMGAYSILTIDDGRFDFSGFTPVQSLPIPELAAVPSPSAEYAENYDEFRSDRRFWLGINLTPDFPTAAQAILSAYEVAEGERLDGVILADPFALEALLKVTGPAYVSRLDRSIGASEAVDFTANGAYTVYRDPAIRKRVLGAVAESVFTRFLSGTDNGLADLRVLAKAASAGHVLAYSGDPVMEGGLAGTGAGGTLPEASGDVLSVIENSAGGTKVDYFQERQIRYDVDLWDDGQAEASTSVEFTNEAPNRGQPRYVIGPRPGYAALGEDVQLVSVYCNACALEDARRDGAQVDLGTGSESGLTYFRDYFGVPSGGSRELRLSWHTQDAWDGGARGGSYRLSFAAQRTIRPTSLEVRITPPSGMHIVSMTPGMRLVGDAAVWEGLPDRRLELEVAFRPPLLTRVWRALTT